MAARDRDRPAHPVGIRLRCARATHPPCPRSRDVAGTGRGPFTRPIGGPWRDLHRKFKYPVESWSSPGEQDKDSSRHMEERTPFISQPGAPGSAIAESARERAWAEFVVRKREPAVAPVVLDSWVRSRDVFQIDPALERSPIVLPRTSADRRRERLEAARRGGRGPRAIRRGAPEDAGHARRCVTPMAMYSQLRVIHASSRRPPRSICASAGAGPSRPPARTASARR